MQGNMHNRHSYREQSGSHACIQIHINRFPRMLLEKHFPISLNISQIMFSKSFRVFHSNDCPTIYRTTLSHCIFKFLVFTSKPHWRDYGVHTPVYSSPRTYQACIQWYIFLYSLTYLQNQNGCAFVLRYGRRTSSTCQTWLGKCCVNPKAGKGLGADAVCSEKCSSSWLRC